MINCKYCGKELKKGLVMHERHCEKNPEKGFAKIEPEKKSVIITDVQQYISDDYNDGLVAWFDDGEGNKVSKVPVLSGILQDGFEKIPVMLLPTVDGLFLPPFMFQGFLGMYPRNQVFSEVQQPDTTEPFPPFAEDEDKPIIESTEPIKSPVAQEVSADSVIASPEAPAKQEKKGFLGFLHKNKEPPKKLSNDVEEMLKKISNV